MKNYLEKQCSGHLLIVLANFEHIHFVDCLPDAVKAKEDDTIEDWDYHQHDGIV